MASASPPFAFTKETTNYYRLCRLLLDVGTQALRDIFDKFHPPVCLHQDLIHASTHSVLLRLLKRRILNLTQWEKLYPRNPTSVSSADFDIVLLMLLLSNICGLSPPPSGWHTLPPSFDLSIEANMVRLKYFRINVYSHASQASVDDTAFNVYWQDISNALMGLGVEAAAIDKLKNDCVDPDVEERYRELLKEWENREEEMVKVLAEIRGMLEKGKRFEDGTMDKLQKIEEIIKKWEIDEDRTKHKLLEVEDSIPGYIHARGAKGLAAYRKALEAGDSTYDKRVKILLVGQDRVGKTSVGKSLRGEPFDEGEHSTDGVEMMPPVKNAGTEAWRNPDYLKSVTVFDQKISEKVTREVLSVKSQPTEEQSSDDTKGEHSGDGLIHANESEVLNGAQGKTPEVAASFEKTHKDESTSFVREIPPEIVPLLEEQLKKNKIEDDKIWPVIWDFAGQDIYRAIHPIFMSAEDIYLLVFDLTKRLTDRAACRVNRAGTECPVAARDREDTNLDHMMRWMDLIHSLANFDSEASTPEFSSPPVIVVGTHAACPDPSKETDLIRKTCQGFPKEFVQHIVKCLPIDNTKAGLQTEQEKVVKLREEILDLADKMPHTKKKIPLQWHRVEKEIIKEAKQGKKYLPKKDFCEEIASQFCKFDNKDDFDELLYFLHARGSIIYHEHSGDKDGLVILDSQWLINVFCEIIKVEPCDGETFSLSQDRVELTKKGILRKRLLVHACRKLKLDPIKDSLISLMEKFNLICKWPARETEDSLILVPCMLTTTGEEGITADEMKSACPAPVYLTFPGTNYVPTGLFCRLVVLFGRWLSDPQYSNEYELYANKAVFALDEGHSLLLECFKTVIKFRISSQSEHFVDFLRRLKEFLETLKRECHWLHSMTAKLCVLCTICLGRNTEPCLRHDKKGCQHHDCAHYITLHPESKLCCKPRLPLPPEPLQPWIKAIKSLESTDNPGNEDQCTKLKGESQIPCSSACKQIKLVDLKVPEEGSPSWDELEWLSRRLGICWKPLARRLGFHDGDITGFHKDNEEYAEKARRMLFKWKERDGSNATYKVLCEALCHEFVERKDLAEGLLPLQL